MPLARRLVEARPGVRWQVARLATATLYRPAFGTLGADSVIVAPRVLRGVQAMHLGSGCAVNPGCWLLVEPGSGPLTIGDHVYLGHDVHVHCLDPIVIGSGTFIVDGVHIGSADHDRTNRSEPVRSGPIQIGSDVFIGQRAVVLGGVTVGAGATIGAHSVVTRDVAPGEVVAGAPARPIRGRDV